MESDGILKDKFSRYVDAVVKVPGMMYLPETGASKTGARRACGATWPYCAAFAVESP
jgi:hypothetical protein